MRALRSVILAVLSFIALIPSSVHISFAQDPPVEWMEIPRADLEMKTCPIDTSAKAMLLADYGVATISNEMGIDFTHHSRIKVFSEAGYTWGTRSLTLYTEEDNQLLDDIEGITYSLDEKGEVVRTKLDNGSIFKEKVDEHRTGYRFAFRCGIEHAGCRLLCITKSPALGGL